MNKFQELTENMIEELERLKAEKLVELKVLAGVISKKRKEYLEAVDVSDGLQREIRRIDKAIRGFGETDKK